MRKTVLANGCFDPLHYGHLLHLQQARAMGDILLVALTADDAVHAEKGEGRPLQPWHQRAEMVMAVRWIDPRGRGVGVHQTVIVRSALQALEVVRPDVFVKGPDYVDRISPEVMDYCARSGISIRFTDAPKWSATALGNELRRG